MVTTTLPTTSREVRLAARPYGEPRLTDFAMAEREIPALGPGQVLVRNDWMSVDPSMRGRMDDKPSYLPPFVLDEPLDGSVVGTVVASRSDDVAVGTTVSHLAGWRDHAVLDAATVTRIDTGVAPAPAYLGALGTPGLTAWVAVTEVAPVRAGDTVLVSSAAGAVGSVAGQVARRLGASRVIGSTGGPDKAKRVVEDFGFDAAVDYRAAPIAEQLPDVAPEGIDVYVDAVGGDHLQAALDALNVGGRVAVVGAIRELNATEPRPGPTNLEQVARKELSLRGLLVSSYLDRFPAQHEAVAGWLADGSLRTEQTVVDGLDRAPQALLDLLRGVNVGKMLVRMQP